MELANKWDLLVSEISRLATHLSDSVEEDVKKFQDLAIGTLRRARVANI
jgi:hypothetical protein